VPGSRLKPRILPGVCQKAAGAEDVMRGEETQLLGLSLLVPGFAGTVVMPGTHCKWAALERTRLVRFTTAMSGEIYEALSGHSVLRHSLQGNTDGPERETGLDAGLAAGLESPEKLTSLLFKVRAASLLSGRGPDWCAGYLSGLLIGTEIAGHRDWFDGEIVLVGSPTLCALYTRGLGLAGVESQTIDAAEATLAGLKAARTRT
jgi:2-dehydro-3-deoxygalactonokinase